MSTPAELKFKTRLATSRLRIVVQCSKRRAKKAGMCPTKTKLFIAEKVELYVR
jgi:hypothetical protein